MTLSTGSGHDRECCAQAYKYVALMMAANAVRAHKATIARTTVAKSCTVPLIECQLGDKSCAVNRLRSAVLATHVKRLAGGLRLTLPD